MSAQAGKNMAVDSATASMKEADQRVARMVKIGVGTGVALSLPVSFWIASSVWLGMKIAVMLAVMGAAGTIGGLMAVNFAGD